MLMAESDPMPQMGVFSIQNGISWIKTHWMLTLGLLAIILPTMAYVAKMSWTNETGAHGPIVLATGLWVLFRQFPNTASVTKRPRFGMVLAMFMPLLVIYWFSRVTHIVEIEGFTMYGLLVIVLYSFIGAEAIKILWFPLVYLLFIFPPPESIIEILTQPMKILVSQSAVSLLYDFGYPVAGAGVTIEVGQYQLLVAAACAGLNSLISLSALSLFYIYVRHKAHWRYALFLLLTVIPVAFFANLVRVVILILLTYHFGEEASQGFMHSFAGMTMFVTALLTIFAIDSVLESFWRRFRRRKAI